jgi:hypothetical protein
MLKNIWKLAIVLSVMMLLASCALPAGKIDPPTPTASATIPPTSTSTLIPPTNTIEPTAAFTFTPEFTATATQTITPQIVYADVFKETNCRTGPGSMYDLVVVIPADSKMEVIAKDLGGGYWFVKTLWHPETTCWLWGTNAKIEGDTSALPEFTPMPSPTPMPDFTVAFKDYDDCKGPLLQFTIVNTGGFQFRSAYIRATDAKTAEVVETSVLAFDEWKGCIMYKNITPLLPGATGYLRTGVFKKDPRSHRVDLVFMLCTEQNLAGTCVTKTLTVK